jgi:hypothetical protein
MSSSSDVMSYIKDLKTKLFSLEDNYSKRLKDLEIRESKITKLEQKMKDVIDLQNNVIFFNIGGEKVAVSKILIQSCIYDNILKDVIENLLDIGRSLKDVENVFIDRNVKQFFFIIEIMRKGSLILQGKQAKLKLPRNINHKAFIQDINFYFKQDAEKVLEDISLYYYEDDNSSKIVYLNRTDSILLSCKVSTNLPNDLLDAYRASNIDDIRKKTSAKAFFVSYDSELVVELTYPTKIELIEVKPFTFDLDSWYPGEGAGTFIFTSNDNKEWDFLATIPEEYGSDMEMIYPVFFEPRVAKYVKFQTGDFTLSVSYLKIK